MISGKSARVRVSIAAKSQLPSSNASDLANLSNKLLLKKLALDSGRLFQDLRSHFDSPLLVSCDEKFIASGKSIKDVK
jgi:hypothetical protein